MRTVDYVTHGFGGFFDSIQKITSEIRPTGSLGAVLDTPAAKINAFMQTINADPTLRMVAVQTAEQRGLAGIEQTANFFAAAQAALDVARGRVPDPVAPANIPKFPPFNDQWEAWYRSAGDRLYAERALKVMNIMINTASSRVGLNPLTSYLIQLLRNSMSNVRTFSEANSVFYKLGEERDLANRILRAARGY